VRYSQTIINEGNFSAALKAASVPCPSAAGGTDCASLTGLSQSRRYYAGPQDA